jgi:hypothetical protein
MKKLCTFKLPALSSFVLSVYLLGFGGGSKIRVSSFGDALVLFISAIASRELCSRRRDREDFEVTLSCEKYGKRFLFTLWQKYLQGQNAYFFLVIVFSGKKWDSLFGARVFLCAAIVFLLRRRTGTQTLVQSVHQLASLQVVQ